ncbi:MAG: hypothetical protein HOK38_08070, partial [Flavobacteriaceae bacterium]|nr:hypothetical protein [Flavobacteriaceae bacterium]
FSFGQEDIERFKVYNTDNIYTSILLDSATGQTWQLQIGIGDNSSRMKTVLSDYKWAETLEELNARYKISYEYWEKAEFKSDSIMSVEEKKMFKPATVDEQLNKYQTARLQQNGRFKLYPTENTYNFIMVDVIDGRTWQVQWNIDDDKRLCYRIY